MKKLTLCDAVLRYPDGMIYYHDRRDYTFYKRCLTDKELAGEKEIPKGIEVVIYIGDFGLGRGYAPEEVCELGKALGIKVDSI